MMGSRGQGGTNLNDLGHNRIYGNQHERESNAADVLAQGVTGRDGMYRHILIPTDGSELSRRAVQHGLALAKAVGAKVTALTVEGSFDVYTVPASKVYEMSGAFAEHAERAKAHAEKILSGVAEAARLAGVVCETVQIEEDHPYEAIINAAQQRGCDLIVMASHGRSGIAAIVLGSVTTKVLTHTKIPVLVCH
jgi:nucleotide-binding universal stress UspA family protein